MEVIGLSFWRFQTEELNKKYGELTETNLRGFANDYAGEKLIPIHQFEGKDFKTKQALAAKLAEMEQNWISLPKRERKQLYDLSGASTSNGRGGDRDSPPWRPEFPELGKPKKVKVRADFFIFTLL